MANDNLHGHPKIAIAAAKDKLYNLGRRVHQEDWQSVESPDDTWELLNHSIKFQMPFEKEHLALHVKPNLPWADMQLEERLSGRPLNPGETFKEWPYYKKTTYKDDTHRKDEKFSHTYMERFWPKHAGLYTDKELKDVKYMGPIHGPNRGLRYDLGDFKSVIDLLNKKNSTRQAFLPIWFPEDTGVVHGERVPCTLGYHFIIRNGFLHITYYIRSCDFIRHLRDDIYMAGGLVYHIIEKLHNKKILPGLFTMHIVSLHVFFNERGLLKQPNV